MSGVFGEITVERFLGEYWQRQPLLVRGAFAGWQLELDGDDLAGLACEEDVESRLVVHDGTDSGSADAWRCDFGPFEAADFEALPAREWTLLVQAVDQWVPHVARLLDAFTFLPAWRLDDVMVSYAVDGGGVGPHFDHYDVFLVQASGRRRWRTGARCDSNTPLVEGAPLKLLQRFDGETDAVLEPGDMLYVPPGVAHLGTAVGDDCITCSVGFRAPSLGELAQAASAQLGELTDEGVRYQDAAAALGTARRSEISPDVLAALVALWRSLPDAALEAALLRGFGTLVTEPRYPDLVAADAPHDGAAMTLAGSAVCWHPASRFAFHVDATGATVFVDGEPHATTPRLARALADDRLPADDALDAGERALLAKLVANGSLRGT